MSVKLDWTFKELMLKEEIRNSFISAVLSKKIKSSNVLNTYLRKDYEDDKLGILDVRVELEDGTDIEMQVISLKEWAERTLFYTSKMYVERIEAGDKYNVLKKCINISILDFIYLDENEFFNSFHIRNDKTHKMYTDKMGFYLIELPKVQKEIENINDLLLWAKFINSSSEEEIKMLATKNENIEVAYKELKRLSQDEEKRMEYEARQKAIRDYNHLMYQSKQEGIKEGFEKGAYNKAVEIAKDLLDVLDTETISRKTGLTLEQVEKLKIDIL